MFQGKNYRDTSVIACLRVSLRYGPRRRPRHRGGLTRFAHAEDNEEADRGGGDIIAEPRDAASQLSSERHRPNTEIDNSVCDISRKLFQRRPEPAVG